MQLKRYSLYISSLIVMQFTFLPGMVCANSDVDAQTEKMAVTEEIPDEEFWLYMAEFAEDEDLIVSDALEGGDKINQQNNNVSAELKNLTEKKPESRGESL